ncbi:MAG: adenylosuccinate lyase [Patescibacteria group bacterium]|nr:adenylosuccinate lyase [Patescibacteria group bacterium]
MFQQEATEMKLLKPNLNFDYETYLSPFTWRYGSKEMREIWSDVNRRRLWRKNWVELARAQNKIGLVTKKELDDIVSHQNDIDIEKAHEIEKEIYHDVMAEIKTFASQCKVGGGKIHLGATSTDITDNAEIIQIREAITLIKNKLVELLQNFSLQIQKYQNTVCMGYTHLQPAEPTTLGYRLCVYAQDLLWDLEFIRIIEKFVRGKGIKGAVGTSASYQKLLKDKKSSALEFEKEIMKNLKLDPIIVSGQTYPRKIDWLVVVSLANIAQSLHKFNFDLRIMQSPNFGEWSEPRSKKRVGSSAMPFKKNPDKAEKNCSLCRYVSSLLNVAWSNPALTLLERTLDDSANRRIFIPETFLAIDECLTTTNSIIKDFVVFENVIDFNLQKYGIFSSTENLMMQLVKNGADRQEVHEIIRENSMIAWSNVSKGEKNNLIELLEKDNRVLKYISKDKIANFFNPKDHIGIAKERTKQFIKKLRKSK